MLLQNVKSVEAAYGTEVLSVSVSCRYVERMLQNPRVRVFLKARHPEILGELQSLIDSVHAELESSQIASMQG